MNIEEYKKLPLEQLRDEYGNCLIKQKYREATVNTSRTDAFYIWRNGSRGLFWQAVEADDKTAENIHPSVRETVLPIITAPYVFPDDIILPMLSEYWFDDANKLQRWENILQGVFQ